jgi:two-component system chemotaxis response regulator CheB
MIVDRAIGIGGSAGAIDAVKAILAGLPGSLAAPVFVTIHVGAHGINQLARIFDAVSPLEVVTAQEGDVVRRGQVYVAPADNHLIVLDGVIRLGRGPRENRARPAIDPLLRSLGLSYGSGAVGVLLSGYLNDGAAGFSDLKRCGGLTVVQTPSDAKVDDMPLAALRASDVDYRAPVADIAALLDDLVSTDPPGASSFPNDVAIEVDIALGRPCTPSLIAQIADPVTLTCPSCSGVLSEMRQPWPRRYRCQVGHGYTAEVLEKEQETATDEAVRVALRIIEERATLAEKLAIDARRDGRHNTAQTYELRLLECRGYADTLRRAISGD